MTTIYIVGSDHGPDSELAKLLTRRGYAWQCFNDVHAFFYQISMSPPGCAIMDWVLPPTSGVDVVERTRQVLGNHRGVILLTPGDSEEQIVAGLCAGADDCVSSPISDALLVTRIEAVLRRLVPKQVALQQRIDRGPYALDLAARTATVDGCDVGLSTLEFELAWLLFSVPSWLFTKRALLALLWGQACGKEADDGVHVLSQQVSELRNKLKFDKHGFKLQSVHATGYRLECAHTASSGRAMHLHASTPPNAVW